MLWQALRNRQLENAKFRRQRRIGRHVSDLGCVAAKLAVELDGGQHEADAPRTPVIEASGYLIMRFWNHEVLGNLEGVLFEIAAVLRAARNQDVSPGW